MSGKEKREYRWTSAPLANSAATTTKYKRNCKEATRKREKKYMTEWKGKERKEKMKMRKKREYRWSYAPLTNTPSTITKKRDMKY